MSAKTAMKRILAVTALCCGGALPGGCMKSNVTITSEPEGAVVRIDGKERGRTPVTVPVQWIALLPNRITLEHPACYRLSTDLRRTPQVGWILLDLCPILSVLPAALTEDTGPELMQTYLLLVATLAAMNSYGPVKRQHFVLARRPTEEEDAVPPVRGPDAGTAALTRPDDEETPGAASEPVDRKSIAGIERPNFGLPTGGVHGGSR